MKIGTHLRKLRDSERLTTREIAKRIGVSQSTYTDWEHEKSFPSLKVYPNLAIAFNVCPMDLMAYLMGLISKPRSVEEKSNIAEMEDILTYYKNYCDLLKKEKQDIDLEISKFG